MSVEKPNLYSTRFLRANRMNTVEAVRLRRQLLILDKARIREVRITNQDIRMINLTLDYINSSSGHSPEGRPPNYVDTSKREESGPMYLYGERVVSRKFGKKFRRVQSAFVARAHRERDSDGEEEEGSEDEPSERSVKVSRPKSSPPKALSAFNGFETETLISNSNNDDEDKHRETNVDDKRQVSNSNNFYLTQPTSATPSKRTEGDTSEIELKLREPPNEPLLSNRPKSRRRNQASSRTREITKKVNEARLEMKNARKTKPDVQQAWAPSTSSMSKQQQALEFKKSLNKDRKEALESKIKGFMDLYPVKKY